MERNMYVITPKIDIMSKQSRPTIPMKNKRLSSQSEEELQNKLDGVNKQIKELKAQGYQEGELQTHIEKLHEYNELKDVGQTILGQIANLKGVRTRDMYEEYQLDVND